MCIKSASASYDVIGDLSSPFGDHEMKLRKPRRAGNGCQNQVRVSIYQAGVKEASKVEMVRFQTSEKQWKVLTGAKWKSST